MTFWSGPIHQASAFLLTYFQRLILLDLDTDIKKNAATGIQARGGTQKGVMIASLNEQGESQTQHEDGFFGQLEGFKDENLRNRDN